MNRRLVFLLALLVVAITSYVVVARMALVPPLQVAAAEEKRPPLEMQDITVTIEIPAIPKEELPGCPEKQLSKVLGARIGTVAGVPVFAVEPGKPAAKAGIQMGDRLGGPEVCPSSLYKTFTPGKEPRTITWTIHRPKNLPVRVSGREGAKPQTSAPGSR